METLGPLTVYHVSQIVITVALTFTVSLNFALVITLDRPTDGAPDVSDTPIRESVAQSYWFPKPF